MNAAIIGAGSIGGLIDNPNSKNIASHAHAYLLEDSCNLVAICEPEPSHQREFIKRWGEVNIYDDIRKLFENENIDIVSIATPTKLHAKDLEIALQVDFVDYILCEKPLVATYKELLGIKPLLEKSDKKILVNLVRRYDPSFIMLSSLIRAKKWGLVLGFHAVFTKSLLHNGIHMLGVLEHLFGSIKRLDSIQVECENAKGTITCIEKIDYSIFEIDIIFENAKVEIKDNGANISIYEKAPSKEYENYNTLKYKETLENSLQYYARNSLGFLLREDCDTCRKILNQHIRLHEIIFKEIE